MHPSLLNTVHYYNTLVRTSSSPAVTGICISLYQAIMIDGTKTDAPKSRSRLTWSKTIDWPTDLWDQTVEEKEVSIIIIFMI